MADKLVNASIIVADSIVPNGTTLSAAKISLEYVVLVPASVIAPTVRMPKNVSIGSPISATATVIPFVVKSSTTIYIEYVVPAIGTAFSPSPPAQVTSVTISPAAIIDTATVPSGYTSTSDTFIADDCILATGSVPAADASGIIIFQADAISPSAYTIQPILSDIVSISVSANTITVQATVLPVVVVSTGWIVSTIVTQGVVIASNVDVERRVIPSAVVATSTVLPVQISVATSVSGVGKRNAYVLSPTLLSQGNVTVLASAATSLGSVIPIQFVLGDIIVGVITATASIPPAPTTVSEYLVVPSSYAYASITSGVLKSGTAKLSPGLIASTASVLAPTVSVQSGQNISVYPNTIGISGTVAMIGVYSLIITSVTQAGDSMVINWE